MKSGDISRTEGAPGLVSYGTFQLMTGSLTGKGASEAHISVRHVSMTWAQRLQRMFNIEALIVVKNIFEHLD